MSSGADGRLRCEWVKRPVSHQQLTTPRVSKRSRVSKGPQRRDSSIIPQGRKCFKQRESRDFKSVFYGRIKIMIIAAPERERSRLIDDDSAENRWGTNVVFPLRWNLNYKLKNNRKWSRAAAPQTQSRQRAPKIKLNEKWNDNCKLTVLNCISSLWTGAGLCLTVSPIFQL